MSGKKFPVENHSRYYLHPYEVHGGLIMVVIFYRKNYDLWERAVRTTLKARNKLGFVDGSLKRLEPKNDEDTTESQTWR